MKPNIMHGLFRNVVVGWIILVVGVIVLFLRAFQPGAGNSPQQDHPRLQPSLGSLTYSPVPLQKSLLDFPDSPTKYKKKILLYRNRLFERVRTSSLLQRPLLTYLRPTPRAPGADSSPADSSEASSLDTLS